MSGDKVSRRSTKALLTTITSSLLPIFLALLTPPVNSETKKVAGVSSHRRQPPYLYFVQLNYVYGDPYLGSSIWAWAAASRAIGTRKGEQLT